MLEDQRRWRAAAEQHAALFSHAITVFGHATATYRAASLKRRRMPSVPVPEILLPSPVGAASAVPKQAEAPSDLTPRQVEVAVLIARGFTNAQIAEALVVTRGTAANHVAQILDRLGLSGRTQVAVWAIQHGLAGSVKDPAE
jgi:DNA-binding NarL/FixJ family response regulator